MRTRWLLLSAALLPFFHTSCGTGGGSSSASNPTGTGPFDSRGNYVEAWADNPSQWKKGRTQVVEPTPDRPAQDLAVLDSGPPPDAMPLAMPKATVRTPSTVRETSPSRSQTTVISSTTKPKSRQVELASSTKPKPRSSSGSGSSSSGSSKTKAKSTTVAKTTTKPKPKAASSSRYAVKKGDSLYAIAKRYGTTVGALQKANKMGGTSIRPGQALNIPK